jgi:hypothetical protein
MSAVARVRAVFDESPWGFVPSWFFASCFGIASGFVGHLNQVGDPFPTLAGRVLLQIVLALCWGFCVTGGAHRLGRMLTAAGLTRRTHLFGLALVSSAVFGGVWFLFPRAWWLDAFIGACVVFIVAPVGMLWRGCPEHLLTPPGMRLRGVLAVVYSTKTCQTVFEPLLADVQAEWLAAHAAGRSGRAEWYRVRGYFYVLQHVLAQLPVSVLQTAYQLWKASKP